MVSRRVTTELVKSLCFGCEKCGISGYELYLGKRKGHSHTEGFGEWLYVMANINNEAYWVYVGRFRTIFMWTEALNITFDMYKKSHLEELIRITKQEHINILFTKGPTYLITHHQDQL